MNPNFFNDAESYLAGIADDVPLFTNTREGVYSQDAGGPAPPPQEAASDLAVGLADMRAMLMQRRAASFKDSTGTPTSHPRPDAPPPAGTGGSPGGVDESSMARLSVSQRAKSFDGRAIAKENSHPFATNGQRPNNPGSGLAMEQAQMGGISGLQEIDGLQDDELDTSEVSTPAPPSATGGWEGITPLPEHDTSSMGSVRSRRDMFNGSAATPQEGPPKGGPAGLQQQSPPSATATPPQQRVSGGGVQQTPSPPQKVDTSPGAASEALLASNDRRDVPPNVIQGLVKIMVGGTPDKRRKATIAMCNLCCESTQNRAAAHEAGVVAVLVGMMREANEDEHLRRLATACICNLSADPPLKDSIAASGAIQYLSGLLDPPEDSVDAMAATAHAAATLWSLCVDMEHIKPMVAQEATLAALLKQLKSPESFVRGQACGCVGEVCIGIKHIKGQLSRLGAIPSLISLLDEPEHATQRLAASALCNLLANHDDNKRLARENGLLEAFAKLLKSTRDEAVQSAAAGGLYNLVSSSDRARLEQLGVVQLLRKVPISKHINVRLGIKEPKKIG